MIATTSTRTSTTRPLVVRATSATHTGKHRSRNEDALVCRPDLGLYAVLDGIGGAPGGAECSAAGARHLAHVYAVGTARGVAIKLSAAVEAANAGVLADKRLRGEVRGGTTIVAVGLTPSGRTAHVVWSGDSRAYLLRNGSLEMLTTDHLAGRYLRRALGVTPWEPEWAPVLPRRGDRILLCTDGVAPGELNDVEVAALLAHGKPDAARALVNAAVDHGGHDNATVVVVKFE